MPKRNIQGFMCLGSKWNMAAFLTLLRNARSMTRWWESGIEERTPPKPGKRMDWWGPWENKRIWKLYSNIFFSLNWAALTEIFPNWVWASLLSYTSFHLAQQRSRTESRIYSSPGWSAIVLFLDWGITNLLLSQCSYLLIFNKSLL